MDNQRGRDTRARIFAAGDLCFEQHGLNLTLDQVAEAAGTTRMTVHRHTGGREQLVTRLVLRASGRVAADVGQLLDGPGALPDRVVAALTRTVLVIRSTPALRQLFAGGDPAAPWAELDPDERVLATIREFYLPYLDEAEQAGLLRPGVSAQEAVAWLLAQVLLLLVVPALAPNPDQVERFLGGLAVPAVFATA